MTAKKALLEFMLRKRAILEREVPRGVLLYESDINEIRTEWSETNCQRAIDTMYDLDETHAGDAVYCPWCGLYGNFGASDEYDPTIHCINCTYKANHGNVSCFVDGSTYKSFKSIITAYKQTIPDARTFASFSGLRDAFIILRTYSSQAKQYCEREGITLDELRREAIEHRNINAGKRTD